MPYRTRCLALLLSLVALAGARAADLTPTETRWLRGAWPVVAEARARRLPVDVVVQPQAAPGLAPMALAYVDGRCKLVFSLRDNAEATAQLSRIARDLGPGDDLLDAALALMAAHEVFGHCARHLSGQWHATPQGYRDATPDGLDPTLHAAYAAMRATRREEGYADLAALAWARENRADLYARLHAWLVAERSADLIPGSHHDTLAWIRNPCTCGVAEGWQAALMADAAAHGAQPPRNEPR
jgi:hypothetical protein